MESATKYVQIDNTVWEIELRRKGYGASRKERNAASRVYIWPVGETVIEQLYTRRQRPYKDWANVLPKVLSLVAPHSWEVKGQFRWSQKAGCSCGCSPGFILRDFSSFDVYIHIYHDDKELRKEFSHGIMIPDEQWEAAARAMVA